MKTTYENVEVIEKRGKDGDYIYKFSYDKIEKSLFRTKKTREVSTESHSSLIMKRDVFDFLSTVLTQGNNMKSTDECCINPDIEICNTYPLQDILLYYILDNDNYELIDYDFRKWISKD